MTSTDLTRRRLLDTAATLLCKDNGASLAEVAASAGIGRTTLHRYFPTRRDLLVALAEDALERVEAAVSAANPEADEPVDVVLTRVATAVLPLADELRFLDVGAAVWDLPDMIERWYDLSRPVDDLVCRAKAKGELRLDLPTAWVVDLFVSAIWAASSGISDGRIARRDAIKLIIDSVLHGVALSPNPKTGGTR